MRFTLLACVVAGLAAVDVDDPAFRRQWYDQGAEITRYALTQSRYGERRQGDAVFITVTEPLSTSAQVKSDDAAAVDAVPGIKLNATRSFLTGIYPYSVMQTVLQPLDTRRRALKASTSVQEWCGHVFEQLNRLDEGWRWRLFSYFQSEGDADSRLAEAWLEEEFWLRVRIDPASLPTGRLSVVPGAVHRRFAHTPARALEAVSSVRDIGDGRRRFVLSYPAIDRELRIDFEAAFPYRIEAWSERVGAQLTEARATHRIMDPYWSHNRPGDERLRSRLGLAEHP